MTSSHHYVNQILSRLPKSQLHLSTRISRVSQCEGEKRQKVEVTTNDYEKFIYDHVIFACHSDAGDIHENEQQILGSFE